jgi:RimJ/RimL family protein N-acetyltransferase
MITLRALRLDDLQMVFEWENTPELWAVSEQRGPFTTAEIEAFVEKCIDDSNSEITRWIICKGELEIGAIDLFDMNKTLRQCGIGIFIVDAINRNRGYAEMALKSMLTELSKQGIRRVSAIIFDDNKRSRKLFSKTGFEPLRAMTYNGKQATQFSLSLQV